MKTAQNSRAAIHLERSRKTKTGMGDYPESQRTKWSSTLKKKNQKRISIEREEEPRLVSGAQIWACFL